MYETFCVDCGLRENGKNREGKKEIEFEKESQGKIHRKIQKKMKKKKIERK